MATRNWLRVEASRRRSTISSRAWGCRPWSISSTQVRAAWVRVVEHGEEPEQADGSVRGVGERGGAAQAPFPEDDGHLVGGAAEPGELDVVQLWQHGPGVGYQVLPGLLGGTEVVEELCEVVRVG